MAKSRRTKALEFSPRVKAEAAERDHGLCIECHRPGLSNAHFIPKSHGGLGRVENCLTLCPEHHYAFDNTADRARLKVKYALYLKSKYPGWDERDQYYRKGIT